MKKNQNLYHWNAKNRLLLSAAYVLILVMTAIACDDFVDVEVPQNQLVANTVFEESATANAVMTDIYAKMRDAGMLTGQASGLSHLLGNYADELDFYGGAQHLTVPFYNNSLLAVNTDVKNLWNNAYKQLYSANAVIKGVSMAVNLPEAERNQLRGEALFVRAMLHFYLSQLYGNVPYVTTTDYEINSKVPRNTVAEVYTFAAEDLENAIVLLDADYKTEGRVRPNKFVAYALLARIKLYAGAWDEASNAASAVLNETGIYTLETELDKVFLSSSSSTLWQFMPKNAGGNTAEGNTFIFNSGPPTLSALGDELLMAFEAGDLRKELWTRTITNANGSWTHAYKYKQRSATGSSVENSIVFRLSEVYLVRAEARARAGELIGAKEDLNIIRNNAGLGDTDATTQEEIIAALLHERRVELFTEFGHRFFDLKRFGKADVVLHAVKTGWEVTDVLFPLPQVEIDLNPALLPQNSGY